VEETPARRGVLHRGGFARPQLAPHAVQSHRAQVLHRAGAQHVLEAVGQLAAAGAHLAAQLQHRQGLVGLGQHQLTGEVHQLTPGGHGGQRRSIHLLRDHLDPLDQQGIARLAQRRFVLPGCVRVEQARHQLGVQPPQGLRCRRAGRHHQLVLQPARQGLLVHPLPQRLQQISLHHHGHQRQLGGRAQVQFVATAQQHRIQPEALPVEDAGAGQGQRHCKPVSAAAQVAALVQRAVAVLTHQAHPRQLHMLHAPLEEARRKLPVLLLPLGLRTRLQLGVARRGIQPPGAHGADRLCRSSLGHEIHRIVARDCRASAKSLKRSVEARRRESPACGNARSR